jgi:class 3 adenylate cyclase
MGVRISARLVKLMRCSKCGSDSPAGKQFCGDCGAPLANHCPKCGGQNPPGKRFCGDCGTALAVGSANSPSPTSSLGRADVAISAEATDSAVADGERKTVTALFADIKGSMELMEDLDPEDARAIVDPALKLMIDAVRRYDGYTVQSTGDGIFALFGAPIAHEDHAKRCLYSALRLQEEMRRYSAQLRQAGNLPVEARVGVNTGEVVVRSIATGDDHPEYTPIGHSTSLAARMQALAPTGSIAVTDATRKLCEGYFNFRTLGPTRVKGVGEPVEVFEVIGLGPLRTRLQVAMRRGLTRFVGREEELVQMRQALDLVCGGHGQIVAAIGEPGVGKSRLFYEFKAVSHSATLTLEAYSVSYGKASAYLPVIELLRDYFGIVPEDEVRRRREKVAGKIVILDRALEDTLPYLYALLGIAEGEDSLAQMDAQIRRRRMHEALKRIFMRESLNQPLILMFEDLHWIDGETQAVLNMIADALPNARILLLVNYRPEYRHQWGNRGYYTQLRLDPLGVQNADEMLKELLGDAPELTALKRMVTERSEGNPFFIEEMIQALFDTGALQRNGIVKLTRPLSQIRVPTTVQAMLAARIDRLAPDEKDLLQTAAVIGREFSRRLLVSVSGKTNEEIESIITQLQVGEFIYEQPAIHGDEYSFKHALTQEVAYNSLLGERRKLLHERIGAAMESLFAGHLHDHLTELARQYRRSNKTAKAVEYLYLAGEQARNRTAHSEATACLDDALQLLATLPADTERARTELKIQIAAAEALAPATFYGAYADFGAASDQAERALNRALELCDQVGDVRQVFHVLYMLRLRQFARLELENALELDERLVALAERTQVPEMLTAAYAAQGCELMAQGKLAVARVLLEKAIAPTAVLHHGGLADPRVAALSFLSQILWFLGYPEQARGYDCQALAIARRGLHTYSIAAATYWSACLDHRLGDLDAAAEKADSAIRMTEEYGFATPGLTGRWIKASILARRGAIEGSLKEFDRLLTELAVRRHHAMVRLLVVDTALRCGRIKEGLDAVEDTFAQMQTCGDRGCEAEFHRLQGELLLARDGAQSEAESCFRTAIEVAQSQEAKSWELRATMSLSRLLRDFRRRDEARAMLAEIYNWFTEGFDTADLKDAKALLDELSN